jgi:feruloyl esterase
MVRRQNRFPSTAMTSRPPFAAPLQPDRSAPPAPTPARPRPRAAVARAAAVAAAATLAGCAAVPPASLPPATGAPLAACEALRTAFAAPGLAWTEAARIAAGTVQVGGRPVGEHCRLAGKLDERVSAADGRTYAIGFELRLPAAWNGRCLYQANGGLDGNVVPALGGFGGGPVNNALAMGFAVVSSNAGHDASQHPFFGRDPQARLDYGYRTVARLTPLAKDVVRAAYGKAPDRSYIAGCSNGGRHALVAASRHASMFDGMLAGAPGWQLPKAAVANIAGAQQYATLLPPRAEGAPPPTPAELGAAFTAAERQALSAAVLARCDALDGARDGIVGDGAACQRAFDLARDLPTCPGARDGTCLTAAQKAVVARVFAGPRTARGEAVYATFPFDAGHGAAGTAFWEFTASLNLDPGAVGFVFGTPPLPEAGFVPARFALTASIDDLVARIAAKDATYTESSLEFMRPPNPGDLSALRAKGGRVLLYHGVSDAIFSADDTVAWLAGVRATHGAATDAFVRYFPVPGMGHCSGGPATDQADFLSPLVAWVEQGRAPDSITATARGAGNAGGVNNEVPAAWSAARTRPLCPHPTVPRYRGGDMERADAFECRP